MVYQRRDPRRRTSFADVGSRDPVIGRLQAAAPGLRPPQLHSAYEAAVFCILTARRSSAQARRMRARLAEHAGTVLDVAGQPIVCLPPPADASSTLLAKQGNAAALARRADTDATAADLLAVLLAKRGDEAGLARRAETDNGPAAERLAMLLSERGDEAKLVRRADGGDPHAMRQLAGLLVERGDEAGLVSRIGSGDLYAAQGLAMLLVARGDERGLACRATLGDEPARAALDQWRAARSRSSIPDT